MLFGNSSHILSIENIWYQEFNCGSNDTTDAHNWTPLIFGVSFQIGCRFGMFLLKIASLKTAVKLLKLKHDTDGVIAVLKLMKTANVLNKELYVKFEEMIVQ